LSNACMLGVTPPVASTTNGAAAVEEDDAGAADVEEDDAWAATVEEDDAGVPAVEDAACRMGAGTVMNGSVLGPANAAILGIFDGPASRLSPLRFELATPGTLSDASAAAAAAAVAFSCALSAFFCSFLDCLSSALNLAIVRYVDHKEP
jgi:hypothetical protein